MLTDMRLGLPGRIARVSIASRSLVAGGSEAVVKEVMLLGNLEAPTSRNPGYATHNTFGLSLPIGVVRFHFGAFQPADDSLTVATRRRSAMGEPRDIGGISARQLAYRSSCRATYRLDSVRHWRNRMTVSSCTAWCWSKTPLCRSRLQLQLQSQSIVGIE